MEQSENTQTELTAKQQAGQLVKSIRESKGMTIAQAAQTFHTTEESIVKFEEAKDDNTKSDYYQRMFAIRFLKRTKAYNEKNMKIIDTAFPHDIKEDLRKSSQVSTNGRGKRHHIGKNSNYEPSRKKSKRNQIRSIVLFIIVLILLVLGAYTLYRLAAVRLSAEVENPTTLVETTSLAPENVVEEKVVEKTTKIEKGALKDGIQEYTISELPEDSYDLNIEVTGDDYIAITNEDTSDELETAKVYNDGDKIKLSIDKDVKNLFINLGVGSEVVITINGEEIDTSDFPDDQIFVRITNNA